VFCRKVPEIYAAAIWTTIHMLAFILLIKYLVVDEMQKIETIRKKLKYDGG
jgi:hypothetical protein